MLFSIAPFKEIPEGLTTGAIDCVITGTTSAYTRKLYKVASYGYKLRIGWELAFGAMNLDKWNLLGLELQAILEGELKALMKQM